jgi:hypothetical protein
MSDEGCCGKCDNLRTIEQRELAATDLNRLQYELKVALDRIDGDESGLNELTARHLAEQASLFRRALKRGAAIIAERETVNG